VAASGNQARKRRARLASRGQTERWWPAGFVARKRESQVAAGRFSFVRRSLWISGGFFNRLISSFILAKVSALLPVVGRGCRSCPRPLFSFVAVSSVLFCRARRRPVYHPRSRGTDTASVLEMFTKGGSRDSQRSLREVSTAGRIPRGFDLSTRRGLLKEGGKEGASMVPSCCG